MTVSVPNGPIEAALVTALTNASALQALGVDGEVQVLHRVAPDDVENPYVVFQSMTPGTDAYTLARRAYIEAIYKVVAFVSGPSNVLAQAMAAAVDDALNDASLTVAGWGLMYCRREQIVELTDQLSGVLWNQAGGLYRITVAPA